MPIKAPDSITSGKPSSLRIDVSKLDRLTDVRTEARRKLQPRASAGSFVNSLLPITNDHFLQEEELEFKYGTSFKEGHTTEQVLALLHKYGPNVYQTPLKNWMYVKQFICVTFTRFNLTLLSCLVFIIVVLICHTSVNHSLSLDYLMIKSVIAYIVYITIIMFANGYVFMTAARLEDIVSRQFNEGVRYASVLRNSKWRSITINNLVPGDVVRLEGGDCVPADMRIVRAAYLLVDESSITGTADFPGAKSAACTDEDPLLTNNLLWYGTDVIDGDCVGVVTATGYNTLLGQVQRTTVGIRSSRKISRFHTNLNKFLLFISIQAVIFSIIWLIVGITCGVGFRKVFINFIVILIGNTSESYTMTITIIVNFFISRLKKKNCVLKAVRPVETLGDVTVICVDKTGTITTNNLRVSHLFYDNAVHNVKHRRKTERNILSKNYLMLKRAMILSNIDYRKEGKLTNERTHNDMKRSFSPFQSAILHYFSHADIAMYEDSYRQIVEIRPNALKNIHVFLLANMDKSQVLMIVSGTSQEILAYCTSILISNEAIPFTKPIFKRITKIVNALCAKGEIFIFFADGTLPRRFSTRYPFTDEPNFPIEGLRFLGVVSFQDPPKEDVADAVRKIRKAGIKWVMLTGDNPLTGACVARQVGLISSNRKIAYDLKRYRSWMLENIPQAAREKCTAGIYTGLDLTRLTRQELKKIMLQFDQLVFAALTADQKMFIVKFLQELGETVMMIGDGVNDAYAITASDVGVAMGLSGAMVSKRAAALVIADDSFKSISSALEEGMLFFENVQKYVVYFLAATIPKIGGLIFYPLFGLPRKNFSLCMILIDVTTNVLPGISLASQQSEEGYLEKRNVHKSVITTTLVLHSYLYIGMVEFWAALATWFNVFTYYGFPPMHLYNISHVWNSEENALVDSQGTEWTFEDRQQLTTIGTSGFYLSVVLLQLVNCLMVTRPFTAGLKNLWLLKCVFLEVVVAIIVVYEPHIASFFEFGYLKLHLLWPAVAFGCLFLLIDTIRKSTITTYPEGWLAKNTF